MIEEDSINFPHLFISLSTPSFTLSQINLGNNKSNEKDTASVKAFDFKNINTQSKEDFYDIQLKSKTTPLPNPIDNNTGSAQSFSGFVEEKAGKPLANPLTLPPTILLRAVPHQSSVYLVEAI